MLLFLALVAGQESLPCATTGQGYACHQENPGFDFQPDSSAPVLDPMLAGNATAVFLSAGNTSCADWWPEVVDFLFMRVEQNKFLSSAVPGCGHHIGNSAELATPTGSSAATLGKMTTQFEALSVVVTPLVVAPDTAVARELVRSASATAGLVTALTQDAAAHGYDGYVLDFNLAGFGTPDETALAALAAKLANALGAGRSLGLVVPGARASTALAEGLAGSGVIVHMSQTRSAYQFAEFDAAVEAATVQFAGHPLSIGLSLSAADWWGGTERPSITDVTDRLGSITAHSVHQVSLSLDWAAPSFVADQARIDLIQLCLMAPFRGGVGCSWETIAPPGDSTAATRKTWAASLAAWRTAERARVGLETRKDLPYDDPGLKWTRSNFVSPQVMLHDRFLYDREAGVWTVDKFLEDTSSRYGPLDSVLLWHSYPNIGIDDRNQFDMAESLPGGLPGLKVLVDEFHRQGVKVLLPYNPWDTGTNRSGKGDVEALVDLVQAVGADGFNGDTMFGITNSFYNVSVRNAPSQPIASQPECSADQRQMLAADGSRAKPYATGDTIAFNTLSWNYWPYLPPGSYPCANCSAGSLVVDGASRTSGLGPPSVSRYRVLDTRHMAQICERWATERTDGLQHAFLNGMGYAPWESIWGIWNPLSQGDGEATRRVYHLLRFYEADVVMGGTFEPYVAVTQTPGVFCSRFGDEAASAALYNCVNRIGTTASGAATSVTLQVPCAAAGERYWNVWDGVVAVDSPAPRGVGVDVGMSGCGPDGTEDVVLTVPERSYAALALVSSTVERSAAFAAFVATRRRFAETPLATLSYVTEPLQQAVVPAPTPTGALNRANMSSVGGVATWRFAVHGVQVEGHGGLAGPDPRSQPDVQFEWEKVPSRFHDRNVSVKAFLIDTFPVTNNRFSAFLDSTGYAPLDRANFLRHWGSAGSPPAGTGEQPVRWVSRQDAADFCGHEGKRLPTTMEWQLSGQDGTDRAYPWGDTWVDGAVPPRVQTNNMGDPVAVGTHVTGGGKGTGVQDLVGVIWQMTDAYCDSHTCRTIVRGGEAYAPVGSAWYFPAALRLDEQNTLLQLSDGMDRSGGVGFRCAVTTRG